MSTWRGHPIRQVGDSWIYTDTQEAVSANPERQCGHCNKPQTPEGHDPCIGTLPNVIGACCGHGSKDTAYVLFDNKDWLGGEEAIAYFVSKARDRR